MYELKLKIEYIDGTVFEGTASDWETCRGHGINHIIFDQYIFQADSLYYLYQEEISEDTGEMVWVFGTCSVFEGYVKEYLIRENSEKFNRKRREFPDIRNTQVKIGWWREEG